MKLSLPRGNKEFYVHRHDRLHLLNISAFLCLPGPNENPFSVLKYIEESFFNAMEAGHHTLMDFFPT